jgi:outer membrane protein assembly factor BamB
MPSRSLSRRGLLAAGVGALAGGQLVRPALFRDPLDADPSVSTDEWLLPGRSPARRRHVPVAGGTDLVETWSVDFAGEGGYSLVVAAGTVVCHDEDDGLHAFSVADGERRWRFRPPTEVDGGIAAGGGALCCPTRGSLHVLGRGGHGRWRLPEYRRRSVLSALFGASAYLPVGSTLFSVGDRGLEARDLSSGLRYWAAGEDGAPTYDDPVAFADGTLYCSDSNFETARFSAYEADTGAGLWATAQYDYLPRDSMVVDDTLLAVGGHDASGRIQAFATTDGTLRWERTLGARLYDPAVADGLVVCPALENELYAFDLDSGDRRWQVGFPDDIGGVVLTDDHCYVHRSTGVDVRDPATGERLAGHDLDGGEARALAYADGRLFASQEHALAVLEVADD